MSFHTRVVHSKMFLSASHEIYAYTLILTWLMTFFVYPEQILEHPARPIIGSFNPCFGWDYAPASYIALTTCSVNVFLTWRYAYLEIARGRLLSPSGLTSVQTFSSFAACFLALASNLWLLLWIIGPGANQPRDNDGPHLAHWMLHTGIFVTYAAASFMAQLGNVLEVMEGPDKDTVTNRHRIFIGVYGVSLGYLVLVYGYDLYMYRHGQPPALPGAFTQIADIFWVGCLAAVTSNTPNERPLKITMEVMDAQTSPQDSLQEKPCLSIPNWLKGYVSLLDLCSMSFHTRVVHSKMFLSASHEIYAYTLILTWLMTFFVYPEQILEHPARPIIGSFNPCFGWDYAPASYIALTTCSVNVFLTWRYAYLEIARGRLLSPSGLTSVQTFSSFAACFLALASNLWLLLWIIGPGANQPRDNDGPHLAHWMLHTGIFVTYAAASFMAQLGNVLEVMEGPDKDTVTNRHRIFIGVYGVSLGYLVLVYGYDLYMYRHGQPPALPGAFTQIADIFWVGCLAAVTSNTPNERPLKITMEVMDDEEHKSLTA